MLDVTSRKDVETFFMKGNWRMLNCRGVWSELICLGSTRVYDMIVSTEHDDQFPSTDFSILRNAYHKSTLESPPLNCLCEGNRNVIRRFT
jgi:hypothetical protein